MAKCPTLLAAIGLSFAAGFAQAGSFAFTAPEGASVPVLNGACKDFLALPADRLDEWLRDARHYGDFKKAGTRPCPIRFAWDYTPDADERAPKRFFVTVRKVGSGRIVQRAETRTGEITLDNFEIAANYVFRAAVCDKKGRELFGADRPFRTEDLPPRVLNVEGVDNFRDLGGWIGEGGRRVKQGLVYRSQGLNDNASYYVRDEKGKKVTKPDKRDWRAGKLRGTPESRRRCRATLGIRTELDLRRNFNELWGVSGSPLGSSVDWRSVMSYSYGGMDKAEARVAFARDFRTFLNRDNYPIVFHCIGGADRTGTLAYILNGLLGVGADDLDRDYHLTAACMDYPWPMTETNSPCRLKGLQKVLARYPGATVNERIRAYVLDCGITEAEIATFKAIMFGEGAPPARDAYETFFKAPSSERRELMRDAAFRAALKAMDKKWNGVGKGVPRWHAEARNCRDLGGWRTKDGARIRFGRLFRSAAIDRPEVRTALVRRLGVKTDLDLRKPDEAKPTPDLPAVTVAAPNYAPAVKDPKWLRAVFDVLLDEAKYPIVFHCAKGADRTGTLAAAIELLLGVDEDDVAKDWQLTAVYNPNPAFESVRYDGLMAALAELEGDTWQAKAESWVRAAGVTDAEIAKFRALMLERPKIVFGLVSDTHVSSPRALAHGKGVAGAEDQLRQAFRWMASEGVDAVVNVGDITELGTMEEVEIYWKIFEREFEDGRCRDLKRPVAHFSVWGNHDCHDASYMRRDPELWGITNELEHILGNKAQLNERLCGVPFGDGTFAREIHGVWFAGVSWKNQADGAAAIDRAATAAGPSNACFFVKHAPALTPDERAALARHSNCVRFTGHTHTPLTATNAITVANGSVWCVSGSTSRCKDGSAQAAIVRVWEDGLTIDRREVLTGDRLGTVEIPLPASTNETAVWQAKIDAASAAGGGRVVVPPGTHPVAELELKSNVTLELAEGARLTAVNDSALYRTDPTVRMELQRTGVLVAYGATNIALVGRGTVDGGGDREPRTQKRPIRWRNVYFEDCRGVEIRDVRMENAASWTCYLNRCDGVHVKGVTIRSIANYNNDGLDLCVSNALIEDCDIISEDDAIVMKNFDPDWVSENVEIRNCRLSSNAGYIKFGTETHGILRNFDIHDCELVARAASFHRKNVGKVQWPGLVEPQHGTGGLVFLMVDGGILENVRVHDITMRKGVCVPLVFRLGRRRGMEYWPRMAMRNITLERVRMTEPALSAVGNFISGVPGLDIDGITIRDSSFKMMALSGAIDWKGIYFQEQEATNPGAGIFQGPMPASFLYARHARNVTLENVTVETVGAGETRPPVVSDAKDAVSVRGCAFGVTEREPGAPNNLDEEFPINGLIRPKVERDLSLRSEWRARYRTYRSSADDSIQPLYWYDPGRADAVPLVVALHSWGASCHWNSPAETVLDYCKKHGWAMVYPNFRGPNVRPEACGSDLAVQDIVDAVDWAKAVRKIDASRVYIIGGSGGGHMTLLMAGRHPEIFAGAAAFCPISDLARWQADSTLRKNHYADNIVAACGGLPDECPDEYAKRSPLTHLPKARAAGLPVYIATGIHDGHTGSVPVGHAIRAFNALADEKGRISEDEIAFIEAKESVPERLRFAGNDPFYGEKIRIHLRATSANARLTVFEGGHGGNYAAGLDFLSRQRKGCPMDATLPSEADAPTIESVTK